DDSVEPSAHAPAHSAGLYEALGWQRPANLFHLRKHRGDADKSRDAPDRSLSGTQRLEPDRNIEDRAADSAWPCPCSKTPPQQGSHGRMATSLSKNEGLVIFAVRKYL